MSKSWREVAAPIIEKVLADTAGKSEGEIKLALYDAYPFGERQYHPYKIWLDEIRQQRGIRSIGPRRADKEKLAEWERIYGKRSV
jgi:hypothetical protein